MPNFVTTEQVLERVAEIMRERLPARVKEMQYGANALEVEDVRAWGLFEHDWSGGEVNRANLPRGIVDLDERRSERREQDTGETATIDGTCTVMFQRGDLTADALKRRACRYGDAMLYTLMREAKAKRPKDGVVLPGLFRIWPASMTTGTIEPTADTFGAQVRWTAIIDTQDAYAA